jgi:hypothetical protein
MRRNRADFPKLRLQALDHSEIAAESQETTRCEGEGPLP